MKRILAFTCWCIVIVSCNNKGATTDNPPKNTKENVKGDLNSRAARHVEAQLKIDGTEHYTMSIFKSQLDGDGKEDAIITVNRYDFAINTAKQSPNAAKLAEIGYVGNYNYIFFYDGGLDMISPAIAVPSSPYLPLTIEFEPITSSEYSDILVTYRIRNSAYKAFFTVENHTPARYFEWPLFNDLGATNQEAFAFSFISTAMNPRKNIQIFNASITLADTVSNYNLATPAIIRGNKLLHEFFYLPAKQTYVTRK